MRLDVSQSTTYEIERKLDRFVREHVESFQKEMVRPLIMNNMWQSMQTRDTKALNLDKDLEEIMSKQ